MSSGFLRPNTIIKFLDEITQMQNEISTYIAGDKVAIEGNECLRNYFSIVPIFEKEFSVCTISSLLSIITFYNNIL